MRKILLAIALLCPFLQAQSPNVTLTGKIQGPNGLPLANNIITLQPTQTGFVAGAGGSSVCNSYIVEINGTALTCNDTINFNSTIPAAPANSWPAIFATSNSGGVDSVSASVTPPNPANFPGPINTPGPLTVGPSAPAGISALEFNGPDPYCMSNAQGFDQLSDCADPATGSSSLGWDPNGNGQQFLQVRSPQSAPFSDGNFWVYNSVIGLPAVAPKVGFNSQTGNFTMTGCTGLFLKADGTGCAAPLPTNPQTGDTLCYNCNGDSAWDTVNYTRPYLGVYAVEGTGTLYASGFFSELGSITPLGSSANTNPTATLGAGNTLSASASGSTSTVIGMNYGQNGNNSLIGGQAWYRWSYRAAMGNTTNVRYWHGLGCYHSTGTGNNGASITGSTAYATDTPNKSTEGFLYDPAINTHWQAVVVTAGSSSGANTTVDTGVVEDTNIHLFEMTTNTAGTSILFWIDGTNVATISTNLPPPANNQDSWMDMFFTGDNKDTATAISETFYSMQMSLKL